MKRILFLGAGHNQIAPIEYARRAGLFVVTCDNRPDNPGHVLAARYHNVSTTDKEGVLGIARAERVDGVVCYGSDVSAPTAAYVCERLELPGNPYDAVRTLTHKGLFRRFQKENGFFCPPAITVEAGDLPSAGGGYIDISPVRFPVIVKPVDASGGRGVTKLRNPADLLRALKHAVSCSLAGQAIVEELVEALGYQVCGEGFLQAGRIIFHAFANEHFSESVVPVGESFPSVFDQSLVDRAVKVLEEMLQKLGMRQGPFNFDLMFTRSRDVFVIEIGPRNGGNRMPEAVKCSTSIDTIKSTVDAALGHEVTFGEQTRYFCATYSLHAKADGVLDRIEYLDGIERHIVDRAIFYSAGDPVKKFTMGSNMIGCLILSYDVYVEMLHALDNMDHFISVKLS